MRPLRLEMQAFGPYRGREIVDFSELGPNRVFLIHGETGAGKTTVLDAMVFALYGDTSGGDRSGVQMRCESAAEDLPTEAVFEFSLGERRFRVRRRPAQELLAQRGDRRLVPKPAEAALWDRTNADAGDEGTPLATKPRDVDAAIKELLGFSCDQFRQVVVLPQGKFRELLSAGSDKREEILRQLFRTEPFAEVERRLSDRAKEVRKQRETLQIERGVHLNGFGVADESELADLAGVAERALSESATGVEIAETALRAADAELKAAEDVDNAVREVAEAAASMTALEERDVEMTSLEARLQDARRAEKVAPAVARATDVANEREQAVAELARAGDSERESRELETAAAQALEAELERKPEREAARERVGELERLRATATEWLAASEKRAAMMQTLEAAEESERRARELRDRRREELADFESGSAAAGQAASELGIRRAEHKELERRAAACEKLASVYQSLDDARIAMEQHQTARDAAHEKLAALQAECTRVEAAWRAGRAAALAAGLHDGEPCPVCGSPDHPAPAKAQDGSPGDDALDSARSAVENARIELESSRDAFVKASKECALAEHDEQALLAELGSPKDASVETAYSALLTCRTSIEELEARSGERDWSEAIAEAKERLAEAQTSLDAAEGEAKSQSQAFAVASQNAERLEAAFPQELRADGALEAAIAQAHASAHKLETALADAQAAAADAGSARAAAEAVHRAAIDREKKSTAAQQAAADALEVALAANGFASLEELHAAATAEDERGKLEAELAAWREDVQRAKGRLEQARKVLGDREAHRDLDALRTAKAEAEREANAAREQRTKAEGRREQLRDVASKLAEIDAHSAEMEAEYRVIGMLSEVACGQYSGAPARISFQRWALGAYLDEVLAAASRRLDTMSKGRYALERQRSPQDRRSATGLEIAVFDEYSGTSRSAVTLSGGESFLAALSLALGLAETVQEHAGGTRLETIFVDEGFGALDPDALELAMDALMELQGSGRLVGVISHVPELRQVINARLAVTAGPEGSSARFIVP